jgi:hypothetical protein
MVLVVVVGLALVPGSKLPQEVMGARVSNMTALMVLVEAPEAAAGILEPPEVVQTTGVAMAVTAVTTAAGLAVGVVEGNLRARRPQEVMEPMASS